MRMRYPERTIMIVAAVMILIIYAMSIYKMAIPYKVYLDKKSDYEFAKDQFYVAQRSLEEESYEELKDKRAYAQRTMSDYENRVHDAMFYSSFMMAGSSFPFLVIYMWYQKSRKIRKNPFADQYGYRSRYGDEEDYERPGVQ